MRSRKPPNSSSGAAGARNLQDLHRVGLDYIHVGQQATTLSGGEASASNWQRTVKRATGRTLYILDEPTTGCISTT